MLPVYHERLRQHVQNAVVKVDARGPRITKDHKMSTRRIDLAVAGVVAYDLSVREQETGGTWLH